MDNFLLTNCPGKCVCNLKLHIKERYLANFISLREFHSWVSYISYIIHCRNLSNIMLWMFLWQESTVILSLALKIWNSELGHRLLAYWLQAYSCRSTNLSLLPQKVFILKTKTRYLWFNKILQLWNLEVTADLEVEKGLHDCVVEVFTHWYIAISTMLSLAIITFFADISII